MINFYKIFNRLSVYFAYIFNDRHHCFEVKLLSSRGVFSVIAGLRGNDKRNLKKLSDPSNIFLALYVKIFDMKSFRNAFDDHVRAFVRITFRYLQPLRGGQKLSNSYFQAFMPGLGTDPEMFANTTAVKSRINRAHGPGGIISSGHRLYPGCPDAPVQTGQFHYFFCEGVPFWPSKT